MIAVLLIAIAIALGLAVTKHVYRGRPTLLELNHWGGV